MSAVDANDLDDDAEHPYRDKRCSGKIPSGRRTTDQDAFSVSVDPLLQIPLLDSRLPLWFWANVVVWQHEVAQGECWSWRRPFDPEGYGQVNREIPNVRAPHMAWEALVGPVPYGMFLDHLCLNRACVRPAHLKPVVILDNAVHYVARDPGAADHAGLLPRVRERRSTGNHQAGRASRSLAAHAAQGELFSDHCKSKGTTRKSERGLVQFGDPRLPKRFWNNVKLADASDECWEWCGSRERMGYGRIIWAGTPWKAHRVSYAVLVEPIPEGYDVHHRCKNPACVRPDHLMAVTRREHLQLDQNPIMQKSQQTHCIRGHAFTSVNTFLRPGGERVCRRCAADRVRELRARDPEATREKERLYMRDYRRRKAVIAANGKPVAEKGGAGSLD